MQLLQFLLFLLLCAVMLGWIARRANVPYPIALVVGGGLLGFLPAMPQTEAEIAKRLRNAAVRAERAELIRIWRLNRISDEVLHQLEEELDYQESRT